MFPFEFTETQHQQKRQSRAGLEMRFALSLFIFGLVQLSCADVAEDPEPPPRRFNTAEMADALMETALSPAAIQQLIPRELQESVLAEPCAEEDRPEEARDTGEAHTHTQNQTFTEAAKTYKVTCDLRNTSGIQRFAVLVLNASQDLMEHLNANSSECSLVLFYTPWCQFSASLAPHFNALPRVFPSMHFLALDASQHSSLSTRFGTVAVPNILLFQGAKPMARFNQTERTLETLASFIANQTGFEASPDQAVEEDDRVGPLPAAPVRSIDWLFVFSVLFISGFTLYAILCTDSIRWLVPGQDHEHQD